jgi:hypothetical protein
MTTHEALKKARAYLLEFGWNHGGAGQHGGPRCAVGAICSVGGFPTLYRDGKHWGTEPALRAASHAIGEQVGSQLPGWNDQPGRTFDEVIDAFDKAIIATAPPREDTPIFTALEDLPAEAYLDCLSTLALTSMEALA